jgi:hypothetical protein
MSFPREPGENVADRMQGMHVLPGVKSPKGRSALFTPGRTCISSHPHATFSRTTGSEAKNGLDFLLDAGLKREWI